MDHGVAAVAGQELGAGLVRAAGGIVVRHTADGSAEVALVHRPHRFDWTFPKGKLEPGESFEECARREVFEESGFWCRLGRFIGHTEYLDKKDRRKVVAYWIMTVEAGRFLPNEEVDELRWLSTRAAAELLTYERDRELLDSLAGSLDEGPTAA